MEEMNEQPNNHNMLVMKELGDLKTLLAVNNSETNNIKNKVEEIKIDVKELKNKVEFQNGRVRTLEDWSHNAQTVIENTTKIATETFTSYKTDKTRIWAVIGVGIFLGGTIIGLAIMAIDSKIQQGIDAALTAQYNIENEN